MNELLTEYVLDTALMEFRSDFTEEINIMMDYYNQTGDEEILEFLDSQFDYYIQENMDIINNGLMYEAVTWGSVAKGVGTLTKSAYNKAVPKVTAWQAKNRDTAKKVGSWAYKKTYSGMTNMTNKIKNQAAEVTKQRHIKVDPEIDKIKQEHKENIRKPLERSKDKSLESQQRRTAREQLKDLNRSKKSSINDLYNSGVRAKFNRFGAKVAEKVHSWLPKPKDSTPAAQPAAQATQPVINAVNQKPGLLTRKNTAKGEKQVRKTQEYNNLKDMNESQQDYI